MSASRIDRVYRLLINIAAFQLGWAICVLLGNAAALLFIAAYLPVHGWLVTVDRREWYFIAGVSITGIVVDSFLLMVGVLQTATEGSLIPVWLMALWVLFASTISHALYWLHKRLLVAAICGACAGPFSYFTGARLSDIDLGQPLWQSLLILSLVWITLFPTALWMARWLYETD